MNEPSALPHPRPRRRASRDVALWDRDDFPTPEGWEEIFDTMTKGATAGQWGRRAALVVAQTRTETGEGPTFLELFHALLPATKGLPAPLSVDLSHIDRRYAINRFRYGCAIAWSNLGWIRWRRDVERSLDTGPRFSTPPESST